MMSAYVLLALAATGCDAFKGPQSLGQLQNLAHTRTPVARRHQVVVAAESVERAKMDDGIFQFNKVVIDTVYDVICLLYPVTGGPRDFARFYVLETVARVPYFAYLSVMHLRETFGEREPSDSERMRTHYAEADNELHHLLIMESLGGNSSAIDRGLAQTMAFFYYWYVTVVYAVSEPAAYHLSELIEDHAFNTYNGFLNDYEEKLKGMPVPDIARKYVRRVGIAQTSRGDAAAGAWIFRGYEQRRGWDAASSVETGAPPKVL